MAAGRPIRRVHSNGVVDSRHFSRRDRRATRSNRPHPSTIMPGVSRMLHEKQRLAARGGYRLPRSRGFGAAVTQFSAVAGPAEAGAQPVRRNSARANSPAMARVVAGAELHQPVQHAADRGAVVRRVLALAGPARQQQPRLLETLEEAEAGGGRRGAAGQRDKSHGAEFAVDDAGGLDVAGAVGIHPGGEIGKRRQAWPASAPGR